MMQVGGEAVDPVPDGGNPPESASADTADHVRQNGNGMAPGSDTRALRDPPWRDCDLPALIWQRGLTASPQYPFPAVSIGEFSLFDPVITA